MKQIKMRHRSSTAIQATKNITPKFNYWICCFIGDSSLLPNSVNEQQLRSVSTPSEGIQKRLVSIYEQTPLAHLNCDMNLSQTKSLTSKVMTKQAVLTTLLGRIKQTVNGVSRYLIATHLNLQQNALYLEFSHHNQHEFYDLWKVLMQMLSANGLPIQLGVGPTPKCAQSFANQYANTYAYVNNKKLFWRQWYHLELRHLPISQLKSLRSNGFTTIVEVIEKVSSKFSLSKAPILQASVPTSSTRSEIISGLLELFTKNVSIKKEPISPTYCDSLNLEENKVYSNDNLLCKLSTLLNGLEAFLIHHQASVLSFDLTLIDTTHNQTHLRIQFTEPQFRAKQFLDSAFNAIKKTQTASRLFEIQLKSTELIKNSEKVLFNPNLEHCGLDTLIGQLEVKLGQRALKSLQFKSGSLSAKEQSKDGAKALPVTPQTIQMRTFFSEMKPCPLIQIDAFPITDTNTTLWKVQSKTEQSKYSWLKVNQNLYCQGSLALIDGPHHLSLGRWNTQPVQKEYFVAKDTTGQLFWIHKKLQTNQWFLQGIFVTSLEQ